MDTPNSIVSAPVKIPLPETLKRPMAAWRAGIADMPAGYIEFHKGLAMVEKARLEAAFGLRVHATRMVDDGWFDGMRALEMVCETRSGRLLKLKWHDTNQGFMVACASGGHGVISPKDLA